MNAAQNAIADAQITAESNARLTRELQLRRIAESERLNASERATLRARVQARYSASIAEANQATEMRIRALATMRDPAYTLHNRMNVDGSPAHGYGPR